MIVHSIIILCIFLGCIVGPIMLAAPTDHEDGYKPDPRDETATDTHFLKG